MAAMTAGRVGLRNRGTRRVLHLSVRPPTFRFRLPRPKSGFPLPASRAALAALLAAAAATAVGVLAPVAAAAPALSWSGPANIDGGQALAGVSCASLSLCVAVDAAGGEVASTNPAAGTGATWSGRQVDGGHALSAVSCPTAGLCVAVDGEGRALASVNPGAGAAATWRAFEIDPGHALNAVSCASAGLCVAVDASGRALVSVDPAVGAWSAAEDVDGSNRLTGVSCAQGPFCLAVDAQGRALVSTDPAGGAGAWYAREIDPSAGLVGVSCAAAGTCVAVDGAGSAFASTNAAAAVSGPAGPGSGATWSTTAFDAFGAPNAVSCTVAGLCVTVDGAGEAFASDDTAAVPPQWMRSEIDTPRALSGVACVAEGLCVAVDGAGRLFTELAGPPAASTASALEVTHTTAIVTGFVNSQDAALSGCRFEYGTSATYGSSVPCSTLPSGSGGAPVSAALTGLAPNTTYDYRLVASTAIGTAEGARQSFKTGAPFVVEPHPSIEGTPVPGGRLTCKPGVSASEGVTLAYQWLRDTRAIAGAGETTYTVSSADVSHHLQCRVTASTSEGTRSATSSFVTVPAGGLGTISETTVGTPRVRGTSVSVPLHCSAQAAGNCTLRLSLTVQETLSGRRVVAVAARTRRVTVTVGTTTVHLKPGQQATATVGPNAAGRGLLASHKKLAVRLSVSGTVVGAISASLRSATLTLTAPAKPRGHKASVEPRGRKATARLAAAARRRVQRPTVRLAHRPAPRARKSAAHAHRPAPRARKSAAHAHRPAPRARKSAGGATPASVLAPTPYMGWDSYFTFGVRYNEASVLEQASQLVTRGLVRKGYRYVWLDVGWWQGARTPSGEIEVNPVQWPHGMRWLAETLHKAGLKLGVYTDAGNNGCGGPGQGSGGHYQQDVNTFAAWGVDAVKMDFCGGIREGLAPASAYAAFHEAIVHNSSHRPMLLSICDYLQPGQFAGGDPSFENSAFSSYTFGPSAGNSWRTDTDVGVPGSVEFGAVLRNMDADAAQPQAAGPGHWNDPDYLGPDQGMTDAQFRTQFSMWAMLAAPLMISADLITLSQTSQTTVSNSEAIAIDQDPAGLQARLLAAEGNGQVWVKPLAEGDRAVALLNVGPNTLHIATSTAAIGMPAASGYTVRNVWSGSVSSVGANATLSASVPSDSTVLLRVVPR